MRGPFNTTEAFKRSYPDASALIKIRLFPVFNTANMDTRQKNSAKLAWDASDDKPMAANCLPIAFNA